MRVALLMLLALLLGAVLTWFLKPQPAATGPATAPQPAAAPATKTWTCSMHPQVRTTSPGDCPICGMPLIPADEGGSGGNGDAPSLKLSPAALAMARVETAPVVRRELSREIRAVGKVAYNETGLATITTRVDGYIERLYVDYTGVQVKKGDHLVDIYSPDLVVAQQELLMSRNYQGSARMLEPAKARLRQWGVTAEQIDEIMTTGKHSEQLTIFSPQEGTVVEKMAVEGAFMPKGSVLYRLANLDSVWVLLDIYEYELMWVQYGQRVEITTEAFPGEVFTGMVTFINPALNEETRTVKVRVNLPNPGKRFKPAMYVTARIRVPLLTSGRPGPTGTEGKFTCPMHPEVLKDEGGACPVCGMPLEQLPGKDLKLALATPEPPANAGKYTCPMHPEVLSDKPGECPICKMDLELIPGALPTAPAKAVQYTCPMHPEVVQDSPGKCPKCKMNLEPKPPPPSVPNEKLVLAVPETAVLDTGQRRLVYVENSPGEYTLREVELGPAAEGYFPVLKGLAEGERVAVRGNFLIDSQFQVRGLPSLMDPKGTAAPPAHSHGPTTPLPDAPKTPKADEHKGH